MPAVCKAGPLSANQTGAINPLQVFHSYRGDEAGFILFILVGSGTLRTGGAPTVTYSGALSRTMTQAGSTQRAATSPETSVEIWYLLGGWHQSIGTLTISVPNAGGQNLHCRTMSIYSTSGSAEFHVANGGTATSTNPTSSNTTTKDGALVVALVGNGATTWAPSARSGTQLWDTDHGAFGSGAQYVEQNTAGTQATNWTFGTSEDWAIANASFTPIKSEIVPRNFQHVSATAANSGVITVAEKTR